MTAQHDDRLLPPGDARKRTQHAWWDQHPWYALDNIPAVVDTLIEAALDRRQLGDLRELCAQLTEKLGGTP